jgi:uncharacterized C2H2 Zn-finger protein
MIDYKCNICDKEFKRKTDFVRHLNKKIPCKFNIKIPHNCTCPKCDKTYSTKGSLRRHLKQNRCVTGDQHKKRSFKDHFEIITVSKKDHFEIINESSNKLKSTEKELNHLMDSKKFECNMCNGMFTKKTNMYRHRKKNCKVKKDIINTREATYQKLLMIENKMNTLENENSNLKQILESKPIINNITNVTNNNNNNNNITNNVTNNIQLVAYGKEDKNLLKNTEIFKILCKGFKSVPELVKALHFNEDRPENHNIYISNMRDKYVMIYDGDKWGLKDKKETIESMFHNERDFLVIKYDDIQPLLDEKHVMKLNKFERFDKQIDFCQNKKSELIEDIKLILYNNRKMVLDLNNKLK